MLQSLEGTDRHAELDSRLGVFHRHFERLLRQTQGVGGKSYLTDRQRLFNPRPRPVHLAYPGAVRHHYIVEKERAKLVAGGRFIKLNSYVAGFDQERRQVESGLSRSGDDEKACRRGGVTDKKLQTI